MLRSVVNRWSSSSTIREYTSALILYTLFALISTWPLATRFFEAVPGNGVDSWQNMWNLWWIKEALLSGQNPYFSPMIYYPQGAWLFLHTLNPLNFLISLPVHALFGLVAGYNTIVLFSIVANCFCAYLLARHVTQQQHAALIGGTVFGMSGYLLAQILGGHMNLLAAWPIPLAVLAILRLPTTWSWQRPVLLRVGLAALALALTILADYQYFLFSGLWLGLWLGWQYFLERRLAAIIAPFVVGLLALVLASPLIAGTVWQTVNTPSASQQGDDAFRLNVSTDLIDLISPSQLHPWWGSLGERLQISKLGNHIHNITSYLGIVAVILAWFSRRQPMARWWLLSGVIFTLFAMGPQLQIAGWATGIPLPSAVFSYLPVLNIFRYPSRFIVIALLSLAMLAALGAAVLLARWPKGPVQRVALPLLLGLLLLDNFTPPFPLAGVYIPPFYSELAAMPGTGAVLDVPLYSKAEANYMLFQVVHGRPLVGGYTSRKLPYAILDELPLMRQLAYAQPAPDVIDQDSVEIAPSVLDYLAIERLVLHSYNGALRYEPLLAIADAVAAGAQPRQETALFQTTPAFQASRLIRSDGQNQAPVGGMLVFPVVSPPDPLPFVGIGHGWSAPLTATNGRYFRAPAAEQSELVIYAAEAETVTVTLELDTTTAVSVALNGTPLAGIAPNPQPQLLEYSLTLPPGRNLLTLSAPPESFSLWRVALSQP